MGSIEDGAADFHDLWSAETVDDLHRVLVFAPPFGRSFDAFEPYSLFTKHHDGNAAASVETATLLVTDPRWRGGAGKLIRRIEQSGIIDDQALDLLADAFLAAEGALYWEVPDDWFSDEVIVIMDAVESEEAGEEDEQYDGRTVARREVVPPLCRWAAARLVGRRPERWTEVFSRARQLDARRAAAVVAGLVDVIGALPPRAQELLLEEAVRWPNHTVRRLGIGLVAERKGAEVAYRVAAGDPNAGVRAWAGSLLRTEPAGQAGPARAQRPEPPTLF